MTRIFRRDPLNFDSIPPSLKVLGGFSLLVFCLQVLGSHVPALDLHLVARFALVPARVLQWPAPEPWRLVTYLFLHGGVWHLVFNLLALWMFGMPVVAQWGDREFVKYFFLCGLGGALMHLALSPRSFVPAIGFSGAVFGMLVAFAMLYPDAVVYIYFLIPLKAAHMAVLYGLIEFFAAATDATPGVANLAHLGGMATGYVYIRWWWVWKTKAKALARGLFSGGPEPLRPRSPRRARPAPNGPAQEDAGMVQVDRILDKILASGMESLTDEERDVMRRYSARHKPS